MPKVDPLSAVPDQPDFTLTATREQVAKLSELISDAGKYRRALRILGYDVHPDGGELSTLDVEAMQMWLGSASRRSLETPGRSVNDALREVGYHCPICSEPHMPALSHDYTTLREWEARR